MIWVQWEHFTLKRGPRVILQGESLLASSQGQALELWGSPSPISGIC